MIGVDCVVMVGFEISDFSERLSLSSPFTRIVQLLDCTPKTGSLHMQPLLQPLVKHLWDACLGTISEIEEPEPPFTQVGCYAQAWSVAEVLRCWLLV